MLAGQYLAKPLKQGATLGVLEGVPGVPALDDRVEGMEKGLGSLRASRSSASSRPTATRTRGLSGADDADRASRREGDLRGLRAACARGVQSITTPVSPDGFVLVGFDALPDEVTQIKAGNEDATVAQFPFNIGLYGMQTLWKVVNARPVAANVDTGTVLVTKANAAKFNG